MIDEGAIIIKHLEAFNQSIVDTLISKGINNSGEAAKSLKVVNNGANYSSVGADYIEILDTGRGKGKYAPVNSIQEWVKSKLGITDEKEIKSVAFVINRKIKNEGTEIFKDNTKGLEIDLKIKEMIPGLMSELQTYSKAKVTKELSKFKSARI